MILELVGLRWSVWPTLARQRMDPQIAPIMSWLEWTSSLAMPGLAPIRDPCVSSRAVAMTSRRLMGRWESLSLEWLGMRRISALV